MEESRLHGNRLTGSGFSEKESTANRRFIHNDLFFSPSALPFVTDRILVTNGVRLREEIIIWEPTVHGATATALTVHSGSTTNERYAGSSWTVTVGSRWMQVRQEEIHRHLHTPSTYNLSPCNRLSTACPRESHAV